MIEAEGNGRYVEFMPAIKSDTDQGIPSLSWSQIRRWINSNADELLEFAQSGFTDKGRGLVILASSPKNGPVDLAIQCRYIMPEEIADIENDALDLAQELVGRYDPGTEFVVVTIDDRSYVTSALVAVERVAAEVVH